MKKSIFKIFFTFTLSLFMSSCSLSKTKLIMHRGYSSIYRENTVEAFIYAAQQRKIYGIETDVYLTKDKKPVLIHDSSTYRVSNGQIDLDVTQATYEEVRAINLPSLDSTFTHKIPTLEEYLLVLKQYKKVGFVELKDNFTKYDLDIIFNEINRCYSMDKIVFISFNIHNLTLVRESYPDVEMYCLYSSKSEVDIAKLKKYNIGIDISYKSVTDEDIKQYKSNNLKIGVWTLNDLDKAKQLKRLGVNYITSDSLTSFR